MNTRELFPHAAALFQHHVDQVALRVKNKTVIKVGGRKLNGPRRIYGSSIAPQARGQRFGRKRLSRGDIYEMSSKLILKWRGIQRRIYREHKGILGERRGPGSTGKVEQSLWGKGD